MPSLGISGAVTHGLVSMVLTCFGTDQRRARVGAYKFGACSATGSCRHLTGIRPGTNPCKGETTKTPADA